MRLNLKTLLLTGVNDSGRDLKNKRTQTDACVITIHLTLSLHAVSSRKSSMAHIGSNLMFI